MESGKKTYFMCSSAGFLTKAPCGVVLLSLCVTHTRINSGVFNSHQIIVTDSHWETTEETFQMLTTDVVMQCLC